MLEIKKKIKSENCIDIKAESCILYFFILNSLTIGQKLLISDGKILLEKYYWKNIDENIDRKIIDGKNIKRKMLMEKYLWKNTDKKYL